MSDYPHLNQYVQEHRPQVAAAVDSMCRQFAKGTSHLPTFSAVDRYSELVPAGKMLRGLLVVLGADMYGGADRDATYQLAAMMELTHSALLIHDDIIDNDPLRRGNKTMHVRYKEDAEADRREHAEAYGTSMALIMGDVGLNESMLILTHLSVAGRVREQLMRFYCEKMHEVMFGEMLDVSMGHDLQEASEESIRHLYVLKTSSYTFELPLMLGALYAGSAPEEYIKIKSLAADLGFIFQVMDDELGLIGSDAVVGKRVGSDIVENKKTLHRLRLFSAVTAHESERLKKIFGNEHIGIDDIAYVRELLIAYKICESIHDELYTVAKNAHATVSSLTVDDFNKLVLGELVDYNLRRSA